MPSFQDYYNRDLGMSRLNGAGFQRYQAQPGANGPRAGIRPDMLRQAGSPPMQGGQFAMPDNQFAPGMTHYLIPGGMPQIQGYNPGLRAVSRRNPAAGGVDSLFNTLLMQLGGGSTGQFGNGMVPYPGNDLYPANQQWMQQFQRGSSPPMMPYAPTYR